MNADAADAADDQPQTLTTIGLEEAAAFLRIAPSTLRKRAAAGKVPGYKPGRRWVFVTAEIEAYLRASAPAVSRVDVRSLRAAMRGGGSNLASDLARKIRAERRQLETVNAVKKNGGSRS